MAIINVYDVYSTMADAMNAVEAVMHSQFQPMCKETTELVCNYNRKCRNAERQIKDLAEDLGLELQRILLET